MFVIHFFLSLLGGLLLGVFYFGSLWITVRQLPSTTRPVQLFIGSFLGRLIVTLLGIYSLMDGHWERALFCLLGFLIARVFLVRRWGLKENLN